MDGVGTADPEVSMSVERAQELARGRFVGERFNCAEASLLGLAEAFGLPCECLPRIATGFGGGIGGCGEACGALVGATMALGLKYGRERGDDIESKQKLGAMVRGMIQAFEAEFGSARCIDLTECDMRTPEGMQEAIDRRLHDDFCPKFVEFAVAHAGEILNRE